MRSAACAGTPGRGARCRGPSPRRSLGLLGRDDGRDRRLPGGAGYHFHLQRPTQALIGSTEERAAQISREIETLIRQCPEQYLWGYNRYKRPRGVPAPAEGA